MRIAIYKDTLSNRRGADAAVAALAKGLKERGHDAVLFEKPELAERLGERWDVVVSSGTNELLDIAALHPGVAPFPWPVVQQFHTSPARPFKWKRWKRNRRIRAALRRVSAMQVLRGEFLPMVSGYGPPVRVIGNWSECGGSASRADAASRTILCPAAFAKGKNQALLIKAFARLAPDFPGWTVKFAGNDATGYGAKCRALAERLGVGDAVAFAGYEEDIAAEYGKCAFVAFPSTDEGFPLALVDAAAFGKCAVTVRDWVGAAAAGGGIVAARSKRRYAAALRTLMSSPGLAADMGEIARIFCGRHHSRDALLDAWEDFLASVAHGG